ncbi:MAG: efflux RND transporter permease subunit [Candidatus Riflebacteria bacterium]|nr:efflux RND transporter permease subunit [Candidatus Riflebacteria bacterium]
MESITHWLLRNRALVFIAVIFTILVGIWAWRKLPIDAFPDVTNIQVMILAKASGLSSTDVEQQITFPIEQKMTGMRGIIQIRSVSKNGISQIVVVFEDGTDPYFARQQVFERLQDAKDGLPPGVEPEMAPLSTGLGEIFQYTIESNTLSAMDLRTIQDWVVVPQLRPITGVSEVNSFGGFSRQYQVLVDPERLQKYGLSLDSVVTALEKSNANASGKFIQKGWEQTYVRSLGLLKNIDDIGRIVLKVKNGASVLIKDVAEVAVGHEVRQGAVTRDGKGEVVAGMVIMLRDANSRTVVEDVKAAIPRIQGSLPKGAQLNVFYDRTFLIEACIKTVLDAMKHGAGWVILILCLFLAEIRTALLVIISLPLTFLASFAIMKFLGMSSNLMSLGGLAFSVGMVVDATVVILENARRHLAEKKDYETDFEVITHSIVEVGRPTLFSVIIIVLVLVPLFSLEGMEAKMYGPLALTMLISLLVSLLIALFFMPALGFSILPRGKEREFFITKFLRVFYRWILHFALRFPSFIFLGAIFLLIWSASLASKIGTDFMPTLQEGAIAINAVRLPNAALEGSVEVSTEIERKLAKIPEISSVVCKTGRAEISEDPMGPDETDIFINLKTREEMPESRDQTELVEVIRDELTQIPGLRYSFSQPIALRVNELISGIKSDVAVKIFGDDLEILSRFAKRIADAIGTVPGGYDTKATQVSGMDQIDIEIELPALARYGLTVKDVNEIIETGIGGKTVSTMIEGQRRFPIAVRFMEDVRKTEEKINLLKIPTADGTLIPLNQIVKIKHVESPIEIDRENNRRRMVVETNVRGRDLGGFVSELQNKIKPIEKELPYGYSISYGGQFENQQRAMTRLSLVVPLVLSLIFVLLRLAMGRFSDSFMVLLNLPFSIVGGIIAVYYFGMSLSVSAAVAFIVLLGIAVQNGVLLVAFFRQLINRGMSVNRAVKMGCALRFRPLMMTALTSFIGHIPMLYSRGSGAEIQKPLAVVVNGGLITSTILTLVVLPVLFRWWERRRLLKIRATGARRKTLVGLK